MKKLKITLVLGTMALAGSWALAQQNEQPAAIGAVQVSGQAVGDDDQGGPVTLSVSGSGSGSIIAVEKAAPVGRPAGGAAGVIEVQGARGGTLVAGSGTANLHALAPLAALLAGDGQPLAVPAPRPAPIPNIRAQIYAPDVPHRAAEKEIERLQRQIANSAWVSSARATLPSKAEKTAFLGVVTARADATLRSQLKLKAGLVINSVEPKSSAEAAGLQVHDIIEKCEDQWLINPAQFIGLVRMYYKPGEKVTLTVLREGQRRKVTAKLEERETYAVDDVGNAFYAQQGVFDPDNPKGPVSLRGWSAGGTPGPVQRITTGALGTAPLAPGFVATYGNDKGQFLLTIRDGHQILTAKDAKGKQIFQGLIDTPEQRKLLPQDVGRELEEMEKIRESVKEKVLSKVHEGVQEAIRKAIEGERPAREKPRPSGE